MKVAAICAFPPGFNYGMVSVDLAIKGFLKRCEITPTSITRFLVEEPPAPIQVTPTERLVYSFLDSIEQLADFDLILIWGDFLNSWQYLEGVCQRIVRRTLGDPSHEMDRLIRLLLFADAPRETLERTVVFGGCLLPNRLYKGSPAYRSAIANLYSKAICVAPRDPGSYREAWHLSGGAKHVVPGLDAAFFLEESRAPGSEPSGELLWSWSRTMQPKVVRRIKPTVTGFVRAAFANRVRSYAMQSFGAVREAPLGWSIGGGEPGELPSLLDKMQKASVIVTDTYHATVSALARGVPVICVGIGGKPQYSSLDDKKKELLLLDLGLQDLFVFWEELLTAPGRGRVQTQIEALAQSDLKSLITQRVARTLEERAVTVSFLLSSRLRAGS